MHEYYEKVRKDALDALGNIIKQTVDDNPADVMRAKAFAKRHVSDPMECALADFHFASYVWAFHECEAHEAAVKSTRAM